MIFVKYLNQRKIRNFQQNRALVYGPVLMLASDVLGRVIAIPSELEVGIVTAFIGAPVLMLLVMRISSGSKGSKRGRMGSKAVAHDLAEGQGA